MPAFLCVYIRWIVSSYCRLHGFLSLPGHVAHSCMHQRAALSPCEPFPPCKLTRKGTLRFLLEVKHRKWRQKERTGGKTEVLGLVSSLRDAKGSRLELNARLCERKEFTQETAVLLPLCRTQPPRGISARSRPGNSLPWFPHIFFKSSS